MVKDRVKKHTDNNQVGFKTLCMADEENLVPTKLLMCVGMAFLPSAKF